MSEKNTYKPSHPFYYKLGGRILTTQDIWRSVSDNGYPVFIPSNVSSVLGLAEPKRSEQLRVIHEEAKAALQRDICCYRTCKNTVNQIRRDGRDVDAGVTECPFMAISLKHNHLYHGYATLMLCKVELSRQQDLFA